MKIKTIIFGAAVALLASCGSSKHAVTETPADILNPTTTTQTPSTSTVTPSDNNPQQQSQQQVQQPSQQASPQLPEITVSQFTADLDISLGFGNDSYDLGGKIQMKRNQVVRLNLTFMGFIEVGIIEFTPDYILIVNRMGKEYTKAPYNSMDAMVKNNINFQTIQTMAWNQLYAKDGKAIKNADFGKAIEDLINANIKGGKKASVKITIGKPNTTRDFETYTTPKSSYTEVPAQILMARLMSFAK